MKTIVLFGAGKSSTVLIDYLNNLAKKKFCNVIIADNNAEAIKARLGENCAAQAFQLDILNETERKKLIAKADVVISLMPPSLHHLVAIDCVEAAKHLLTASYVSDEIKALQQKVEEKQILFLCEMGLDPGIDHMSAMQLVHSIKNKGGKIASFKSHCGGLVAPESDDNPWHYKISWNPRNVVMAGKAGAEYKLKGKQIEKHYEELFTDNELVEIPNLGMLAFYPNRDALSYISLYNLEEAETFLRTTLRYPEFCFGWKNIIDLKLTDEEKIYETNGMSIADFFKLHFDKNNFGEWLANNLMSRFSYAKDMLEKLTQLIEAEEDDEDKSYDDFLTVNDKGQLDEVNIENVKGNAAETVAAKMQEANLTMKQLFFLGMDDAETLINLGLCSAADVLQFILEKKLALQKNDKDMIVMMHEIEYEVKGQRSKVKSFLIVKGEDNLRTAMAKTVGLPLGIAAKLILENKITETGLHIPVKASIYEPVLEELKRYDIIFHEENILYEK